MSAKALAHLYKSIAFFKHRLLHLTKINYISIFDCKTDRYNFIYVKLASNWEQPTEKYIII